MKTLLRNKIVLLVLACFLAGLLYKMFGERHVRQMPTTKVEKKTFEKTVIINGNLEPARKTIVVAPFNGFIRKVHVKVGEMVKAGDPVVTLSQTLSASEPLHPIRSGISGKVMQIVHAEGEYMKADDPNNYILRIDDQSEYYVDASAPELSVIYMAIGQPVELSSSAMPDRTFHGKVTEIAEAPKVQEGWRNQGKVEYQVRIRLGDKSPDLFSGLSFTAKVIVATKKDALVIPIEFLLKDNDQYFVSDVRKGRRPVQVGLVNDREVEITSGVSEGEVLQVIDMLENLGDADVAR